MSSPESQRELDPLYKLTLNEDDIQRFPVDSEGGPVVGFIRDGRQNVRIITVEHNVLSVPTTETDDNPVPMQFPRPFRLRYTPKEWIAFYLGVRAGDFDQLYQNPQNMMRDSKVPHGPIFFLTGENWRHLIDATRRGKYDLPKVQEETFLRESTRRRRRRRRRR